MKTVMDTWIVQVQYPENLTAEVGALPMGLDDEPARIERHRLRQGFNGAISKSIKAFATGNGLLAQIDLMKTGPHRHGVFLTCTDQFRERLQQAALPYVGVIAKPRPFNLRESKPVND